MTKLSIVIITKNEEGNIGRCIDSCKPLNGEILVLDSHSTDNTASIAESKGAKVIKVDWQGYGATKNHGASLAMNEWILSLDADEALNEELADNILQELNEPTGVTAYWMYRSFVFNGKQLYYGALKNERRLRLYDKKRMHWNLKTVHEDLVPIKKNIELPYGELQGCLLHYSYKNIEDMRLRLDKYARLSAAQLNNKGKFYLKVKKIVSPAFSFLKNYLFKAGFMDGINGYIFAKEQARYIRNKYHYALNN